MDDDPSIGRATGSLLRSHGFTVAAFTSAAGFIESVEFPQTAFLILDICMPGMGGLDLFRHLNAEGKAIPTVFITAHGDGAGRAEALRLGAIDYLIKPFGEDALLNAIHRGLAG